MKHLYHYTRATNLIGILRSGQINQATAFVDITKERPAVWLSFASDWEPTATPMLASFQTLTFKEFAEIETPMRIAVDPEKYTLDWHDFVNLSGCHPNIIKALKKVAKKAKSNPMDWRLSFEPIPSDDWLSIEGVIGNNWKILSPHQLSEIAAINLARHA